MFNRALNMFNFNRYATAAVEGDGGVHATVDDEKDLENPLLQATNDDSETPSSATTAVEGDGGVHDTVNDRKDLDNPLLQTTNDDSEVPTLSSPRFLGGCATSTAKVFKDPRCEWVILGLVLLIIFGVSVSYFVDAINRRSHDDPGFKLDSVVVVSSFNVSKTFAKTRWDTELSLGLVDGDFRDLDVRYEAPRLWLYSGDEGFVSTTSPSMEYSPDGKKLIMRAVFGMEEDVVQREVVNLDLLMESNAISVVKKHLEVKSFLMIDCNDLKIEFDGVNKKFGKLVDAGKSCRVQVCPIESHPLYDGADECTSNSNKFKFGKL